jgi:hypothetical protein
MTLLIDVQILYFVVGVSSFSSLLRRPELGVPYIRLIRVIDIDALDWSRCHMWSSWDQLQVSFPSAPIF